MTVFFTSDLHLGHRTVSEIRGFNSIEEHDRVVLGNISKVVRPGDTLWILGDVAMGGWRDNILPLMALVAGYRINAHAVLGNHDRPAPNNSNGHAYVSDFAMRGGFASVSTVAKISVEGRSLLMSHYPYDGDHTEEERYDQFRLRDLGTTLLHGHTHSDQRVSRSSNGTLQIHVGLDAWGLKPVPLHQIKTIMEENNA